MSKRIPMEKLPNTRDLGGMIGYGGRAVRPGMLIRSGQLAEATPADLEELSRRIELVVDFRNMDEHVNVPDPEMPGVRQVHLPILQGQGPVAHDEESRRLAMLSLFENADKPKAVMTHIYEDFVANPYCRGKYREFLMLVAEDREKAALWHCAAGKDRAGFATVLVQELLGVSRDDIFEDYMATNVYLEEVIRKMTEDNARLTGLTDRAHREAMGYMFGARIELIRAVYDKTEELFGGFEGLFTEGMQIPYGQIERMRERFLA